MPSSQSQAITTDAGRLRQRRRGLFWAMLAAIVVLAIVSAVAMSGWNTAIRRADKQTARASALQEAADGTVRLQQKMAALQKELADTQGREQALQAQLTSAKDSMTKAQGRAAAAEAHAAAAAKTASEAEQMRAELQAKLDAALPAAAQTAERSAAPQPASNIVASATQSDIAPALPLPGLPPGATSRDYLVAAQQALHEQRYGRAQSALEHAETRLLNEASLTREPVHPRSHPGIMEIEETFDQLDTGDRDGALRTVDGLLTRH